jgi:hypothetical protein
VESWNHPKATLYQKLGTTNTFIFFCLRRFKMLPHGPRDSFCWIVTSEHQAWRFVNLSTVIKCLLLLNVNVNATSWFKSDCTSSITVMTDKRATCHHCSHCIYFTSPCLAAAIHEQTAHRLHTDLIWIPSSTLKWTECSSLSLSSLISIQICLRILMSLFSFLFLLTYTFGFQFP